MNPHPFSLGAIRLMLFWEKGDCIVEYLKLLYFQKSFCLHCISWSDKYTSVKIIEILLWGLECL